MQGAPGSSDGRAEELFSSQPPLPVSLPTGPQLPGIAKEGRLSSWAAPPARNPVPWGLLWVWEGLFHRHPPALSRTGASDGDLILPKLEQSLQVPAEEQPLMQSLQLALQGQADGAASACPARRRFLLPMPFGKKKHQLLELQELPRGGKAPAVHTHTCTCRGCSSVTAVGYGTAQS